VIFDTDRFNDHLKEEVEGLEHVESSPYNEHGVYSPKMHTEMCGIDVQRIYNAMEDLKEFVYEDASDIDSTDHELVLVTRGQKDYQKKKIEGAGIEEKFDKIVIIEKGSKDVADIDFLIDDQKGEIEKAELPGFEFDREHHSLSDALKEAERHEA
jgi:hypothetical protein